MITALFRAPFLRLTFAAGMLVFTPACDETSDDGLAAIEAGEWRPGGAATNTFLLGGNAFSREAENITYDHSLLFFTGNSFFRDPWVTAPASTTKRDGLGPLFNARSCASCHNRDGRGQPPSGPDDTGPLGHLLRLSVPGVDAHGGPLPEPAYGGQLQPFSIAGVPAEAKATVDWTPVAGIYDDGTAYTLRRPIWTLTKLAYGPMADGVMISARVAPAMIGLGLLESISDADLIAASDPDDVDGDGISGKTNTVWDGERGEYALGRFGWKCEEPTVRSQVAGAFLGDMGITSPVNPAGECSSVQEECLAQPPGGAPELPEETLHRVVLYSSLLAVPMRRDWDATEVLRGKRVFNEIGCASCHTPSHRTRPDAALVENAGQLIWPYTDLLLHDMGPDLSDNRPVYDADGEDWRTPPLWGVGLLQVVSGHTNLLHDGRARGVAEAVLWHGGEGKASRDAFKALSATDRAALMRFVVSL